MANNYLTFSEQLGRLTKEEKTWLKQQLEYIESDEGDLPRFLVGCGEEDVDEQGFEFEFLSSAASGRYLWLYAEESGNPQHVAILVQKFLQAFRPRECWSLTYACWCDKPRIGEFGGGAVFVTAEEIQEQYVDGLIHEWRKAYHAKQGSSP